MAAALRRSWHCPGAFAARGCRGLIRGRRDLMTLCPALATLSPKPLREQQPVSWMSENDFIHTNSQVLYASRTPVALLEVKFDFSNMMAYSGNSDI